MIFYHYTTRGALKQICEEGLTLGEAPYNARRVARAVNLTTDTDPSGHGLDMGGHVVTYVESAKLAAAGLQVPPGTVYANKLEARIKIKLPSSDPKLKTWRNWSRKNCDPGYAETLERAADQTRRKAKTWWLYFGVVSPDTFQGIDILVPETPDLGETDAHA